MNKATDLLLPEQVQNLVAAIGMTATLELVRVAGGTTIDVPKVRTKMGEARYEYFAEQIGTEAADDLVKYFGGDRLYIPRCRSAMIEYTHRKIRNEFDSLTAIENGYSAVQAVSILALKHRYSDRHIWNILKSTDRAGTAISEGSLQSRLF